MYLLHECNVCNIIIALQSSVTPGTSV